MIGLLLIGLAGAAETPAVAEAKELIQDVAIYGDDSTVNRAEPWWSEFEDQGLHTILSKGLTTNPDLLTAEARIDLAQANAWQNLAGLLPTIQFEVQGQQAPTDGLGLSPFTSSMPDYSSAFESLGELMQQVAELTGQDPSDLPDFSPGDSSSTPDTYIQSSAMLKAALPIDIVGRQTLTTLASHKDTAASKATHSAQRMQLSIALGQAWYDLVAARQQMAIVASQVTSNETLLELVELRHERGEATALDVLQQRQQLASTQTLLPRAKAQQVLASQRLAVTLGEAPHMELPSSDNLPAVGASPILGSPSRLLTDRPDLRAAIDGLDSARMKRTAAILGLAPTLTLTGQVGRQYLTLDETESADTWGVGGVMTVPLFGGGRTHAGIRAARANRDIAENSLRSQVLAVVQQVESALAQETASAEALEASERQREAARIAHEESTSRYIDGLIPYVNVLAAQGAHQAAQLGLLDAQRERVRARLQLHGALGGTWSKETPQ